MVVCIVEEAQCMCEWQQKSKCKVYGKIRNASCYPYVLSKINETYRNQYETRKFRQRAMNFLARSNIFTRTFCAINPTVNRFRSSDNASKRLIILSQADCTEENAFEGTRCEHRKMEDGGGRIEGAYYETKIKGMRVGRWDEPSLH